MESKSDKNKVIEPGEGEPLDTPDRPIVVSPGQSGPPPTKTPESVSSHESLFQRVAGARRLYAWLFLIVVILSCFVIYLTVKWSKNPTSNTPASTSLSAQQLADLANSTTTVGDAKQTLNVQSNSVFEGDVLLRQGLDVAGSIKVGGSLTLPSITVGGTSSFGELQVTNTLSVEGNTTIQGQLSVQKSLTVAGTASFATLSANQLNVTSLQLIGDLTVSHHIVTSGGIPSKSNGSALGSGGTTSLNGSDTAGTATINTGGNPPAGCFMTITFAQKFSSTPHVVISPSNSSAGGLDYYTNRTGTSFSICTSSTPAAATNYIFDYVVIN